MLYAPEKSVSIAAPPTANRMPTSASRSPICPSGTSAPSVIEPRNSGWMPLSRNSEQPACGQDQPAVGEPRQQLQTDRDSSDLRGQRHQVDDLRADQRSEARPESEALAHCVEDRLAGDGRNAAAHLRVHDDARDSD